MIEEKAVGGVVDVGVLDNDHDPNENLVATSLSITAAPRLGSALAVYWPERGVVVRHWAGTETGTDVFTHEV